MNEQQEQKDNWILTIVLAAAILAFIGMVAMGTGCGTTAGDIVNIFEGMPLPTNAVPVEAAEIDSDVTVAASGDVIILPLGGGVLWKPRSEQRNVLVVLLPNEFRGNVDRCEIHSKPDLDAASMIESGTFWTDTHNGNRVHYLFSKLGREYGLDIYLVFATLDGRAYGYAIPDGGGRWE